MTRKLVAAAASVALVATSFAAAPAQANSDLVKFLAGATALVIIGSALNDASARNRVVVKPRQGHIHPHPRPRPQVITKALPKSCIYNYKTWGATTRMFSTGCLTKRYGHVASLPGACSKRVKTANGLSFGYGPACLRNHGYRMVNR